MPYVKSLQIYDGIQESELSSLTLKDVCICSQIKSQMLIYCMAQECHPADVPKCEFLGEIPTELTSQVAWVTCTNVVAAHPNYQLAIAGLR